MLSVKDKIASIVKDKYGIDDETIELIMDKVIEEEPNNIKWNDSYDCYRSPLLAILLNAACRKTEKLQESVGHTKGPLTSFDFDGDQVCVVPDAENGKKGKGLCCICTGPNRYANAQLYSVSPEMLEALKGVALMLNTELKSYSHEPWATRVFDSISKVEDKENI